MDEHIGIERRRSPRVPDGIKVRIFDGRIKELVPIVNISYHGGLLRTPELIDTGEIIDLAMYLSFGDSPLGLKARVVRAVTECSSWGVCRYNIGVEFLNLIESQKEKLAEIVMRLFKKVEQKEE